jgi:protein gp37
MIFVNSMSDLFHKEVPDEFIAQVFAVMALAKAHTFQVLTKRPGRMTSLVSRLWPPVKAALVRINGSPPSGEFLDWPLPNVWLGTSVEDQKWADVRIPKLLETLAEVQFLSVEPLLGPVDLGRYLSSIDWIIVGGESGSNARPMRPEWVRSLRDQAVDAKVPFFFKQWGGRTPKAGGRMLDGRTWDEFPVTTATDPMVPA